MIIEYKISNIMQQIILIIYHNYHRVQTNSFCQWIYFLNHGDTHLEEFIYTIYDIMSYRNVVYWDSSYIIYITHLKMYCIVVGFFTWRNICDFIELLKPSSWLIETKGYDVKCKLSQLHVGLWLNNAQMKKNLMNLILHTSSSCAKYQAPSENKVLSFQICLRKTLQYYRYVEITTKLYFILWYYIHK